MDEISIVGVDLAKQVFQIHGATSDGRVVFRKKLSRPQFAKFMAALPPRIVAMEACGTAHYWGRELARLGHDIRLIPPVDVKPFVKRQKNDASDAEAIAEAVQRPNMRSVAVKSAAQQARAMLFRTRDLLVWSAHPAGQRTAWPSRRTRRSLWARASATSSASPFAWKRMTCRTWSGTWGSSISIRSRNWGPRSKNWTSASSRPRRKTGWPEGFRPCPGSAQSARWRLQPSRRTCVSFAGGETSRPGWALCRDSIRAAASRSWAGPQRWGSATSDAC